MPKDLKALQKSLEDELETKMVEFRKVMNTYGKDAERAMNEVERIERLLRRDFNKDSETDLENAHRQAEAKGALSSEKGGPLRIEIADLAAKLTAVKAEITKEAELAERKKEAKGASEPSETRNHGGADPASTYRKATDDMRGTGKEEPREHTNKPS
jgi:hypothetical protein